jgi:hypothetical protein
MRKITIFAVLPLACCFLLSGQEQTPASPPQEHPSSVSASEIAAANNPVASVNSVSFQNFYDPALFGVSNVVSNTLDLHGIIAKRAADHTFYYACPDRSRRSQHY